MDAPYQPHSATSREAATKIRPKAETLRALILGNYILDSLAIFD